MGRMPRIQLAGALYHVTTRGTAKQKICLDDWDYTWLVAQIGEAVTRYGWI
jgi:putative transposase